MPLAISGRAGDELPAQRVVPNTAVLPSHTGRVSFTNTPGDQQQYGAALGRAILVYLAVVPAVMFVVDYFVLPLAIDGRLSASRISVSRSMPRA